MRNEIGVSVIIHRPPSDVFASLIDFSKWPQWGGGNLVHIQYAASSRSAATVFSTFGSSHSSWGKL
jgi:hypothetical protein